MFGSRAPLCDAPGAGGCTDPNNVTWHVQNDLQNLRNPDGTKLVPAVQCLDPGGTARAALKDCAEGDTYAVRRRLLVPAPDADPRPTSPGTCGSASTSSAVVLNQAFDPTPGLSAQKLVLPTGATNATAITSNCLEPDDHDAQGYYRSPCLDTSTPDPLDKLSLHFDEGSTITYKITLANSGAQNLTGITVTDSRGSTGCLFPTHARAWGLVEPVHLHAARPRPSRACRDRDGLRQHRHRRLRADPRRRPTGSPWSSSVRRPSCRSSSGSARSRTATTGTAPRASGPSRAPRSASTRRCHSRASGSRSSSATSAAGPRTPSRSPTRAAPCPTARTTPTPSAMRRHRRCRRTGCSSVAIASRSARRRPSPTR